MIDVSKTLDMYHLFLLHMTFFSVDITLMLTNCEFAENNHKKNNINRWEIRDKCEKKMK